MQIRCPKCRTAYKVEASVIPEQGRKLRCSNCEEVFLCLPEDLLPDSEILENPAPEIQNPKTAPETATTATEASAEEQPQAEESVAVSPEQPAETEDEKAIENSEPALETSAPEPAAESKEEMADSKTDAAKDAMPEEAKAEQNAETSPSEKLNEIDDIFKRLSEQTDELFKQEQSQPLPKKVMFNARVKFGLMSSTTRRYLYFLLLLIILLSLFYFRYEIVRLVPPMERAYSAVGIKSRILGEGLEFQNINRRSFEDDYVKKMEIKGFVLNTTSRSIQIPKIHVEILDKEGIKLQELDSPAPIKELEPHGRVAFSIVVTKPSFLSKYIYLTFTE